MKPLANLPIARQEHVPRGKAAGFGLTERRSDAKAATGPDDPQTIPGPLLPILHRILPMRLILASASPIRRMLLDRAGVAHEAMAARVDEAAIRDALAAEGAKPRDIADALAEAKAKKLSLKFPDAIVIGCDQVLEAEGEVLAKARTRAEAAAQLRRLSGKTHRLLSAVVIYEAGQPVWRHVGTVRMTMRVLSDAYLTGYLERNWESVRDCVGAYKLEEEGVRLFSRIEGEYFTVLGLPLIELLGYLALRGVIEV